MALVLSAILLLAIGYLWSGLEGKATRLSDRLVWTLQAKVAGTRLERDLRAAYAADADQQGPTVLLEARADRVVFLARPGGQAAGELIAWDLSEGRLMRRRGQSSGIGVGVPAGGWVFNDNKTLLESVAPGAGFAFFAGSRRLASPLSAMDLRLVDRVDLEAANAAAGAGTASETGQQSQLRLLCSAPIGR